MGQDWIDRFDRSDLTPEMEVAIFWRDYVESGMALREWNDLVQQARASLERISQVEEAQVIL